MYQAATNVAEELSLRPTRLQNNLQTINHLHSIESNATVTDFRNRTRRLAGTMQTLDHQDIKTIAEFECD